MKLRASDIFVFFCSILAVAFIVINTGAIVHDQYFIQTTFSWRYPKLYEGISSCLLAVAVNLLASPSAGQVNPLFKSLALVIYVLPAYLLARKYLRKELLLAFFVVLLFGSRMPFLWLSSELLCGGFLSLAILGIVSGWHYAAVAVILAWFAFLKPEMPLVAAAVMGVYLFGLKNTRKRVWSAVVFVGACFLIILPVLLWGDASFGRSLLSFGQHYFSVIREHQAGSEDIVISWENYAALFRENFPGVNSFADVIIKYPYKFVDASALFFVRGLRHFTGLFQFLVPLLVLRVYFYFRRRQQLQDFEKYILASLVGLLPMVVFAYLHIRYQAKYYPLLVLCALYFVQERMNRGWLRGVAALLIISAVVVQLWRFTGDMAMFDPSGSWWFPD
ncbi:MAG: hypothetical protein A2583_07485 [Bdellovibrionales bacterium RIFOXYD1_FULL_53_11]|nr:MAG: hypothetical protein A2583_07485 [Bdellovibrionales bacterium RIFOXYD1_FULL_53_11]